MRLEGEKRNVPTSDWIYGGVVTPSAQLHIPEDGGVTDLDMNPPKVRNITLHPNPQKDTDLSSEKGLKVPLTVMLGRNLNSSTVSSTPASWRTVLRPARLGWETSR